MNARKGSDKPERVLLTGAAGDVIGPRPAIGLNGAPGG